MSHGPTDKAMIGRGSDENMAVASALFFRIGSDENDLIGWNGKQEDT